MQESDVNLFAYHLVNLVLQEGSMIANAALESGRPGEYLSLRKNVRSDLTYVIPAREDAAYIDTTVDNFIEGTDNTKMESEINALITSTPQKLTDDKAKIENGQGDEHLEAQQNDLSNSTSLFINHLFDISDVELGICDDATLAQNADHPELGPLMTNLMDLYVNAALDAFHATRNKGESTEKHVTNPFFSYLEEALPNAGNDVVSYVDDDIPCNENIYEISEAPMKSQIVAQSDGKQVKIENSELYENTYLTLNRDYDQCSEEEEFPILKDPKGMIMQEIVLLTANTSDETGPIRDEPEEVCKKKEEVPSTSRVSATSHKSGLVQRCRQQGARFLACIRGWWRRRGTRQRKEGRDLRNRSGLSPLSPDPRRRSASLLEHRVYRSPALARTYKCNTINEALLNSSQWKEYTFDTQPYDCGDV